MFLRILFVIFTICLYSYGAWGTGGSYPEYIVTDSIVPPDNSINQSLSVFLSAKDAAGNPYSILGTSMPLRGIATYGPDYFNSDPTVSAFYKFDEKIEYNSKDTSGFKLQYPLGTGNARTLKGVFGNGIALSDSSYAVHFFPPNLGCEIYDTIDIIDTVGGGGVFDTSVGYRWRQAAGSDSAVLVSSYKELNIYDIPQRFYYDRETDPTEKDTVMFWYEDTRKGNPDQIYRDSRTNLPYSAECWVFSREGENTANKFASIVSNQGVYSYGGYTFGLTEMKPFFGAYTWATLPLVEGAGANYVRVVSEKKIPDGRWVHLAYSIDASAAVTLYIDGLRVPTHMDTVGLNGGKIESSMENAGYYGTGNSFSLWGIAPNYDYLSKEFRLGKTGIENYTVFKGYIDELVIHKGKTNASGDYYTMNTYSGLNFSSDPLSFSGSSVNFQVSSPVNSQLMLNSVQAGDLAFSSGPVAWSAEASGDYAGLAVVMPGQTFNVAEGRVENSPAPVDVGEEFSAQVVAVDAHGNKVSSVVPIIESVYIVYDSAGTKDSVQAQYSVDTSYSGTTELKVTQQLAVSRSIESFQLHINAQYFSPISGSSDDYIALSGKFEGLMVVSNGQQYIPGQGPSGPTDTVVIPDSADISVYLVDEQTNNIEDLYTRDLSPTEYEVMPQLSVGDTLWADRSYYVVDQDLPASIAGKQWVRTFFNHKETPINFRFYPTLPVTVYIAFPRSGGLDSSMAVGNGTASIFGTDSGAGVLPYVTDLIGSVTFSAPSSAGGTLMEASDYNGDGTITGDGSGWIDYNTGAWGLEFAAPVQNGGDIKVKYSFNLTPGTITKYFDMHPDSAGKTWLPTADSILVSNWSGGTSARTIWSRTYTGADLNENPAVVLPTPKTGNGNMYVPFISLDADLENVVSLAVNDPDAVVSRVEPADGVIKSPIQYKVHHSSSYPAVVPTAVFDSTIYNNKDNSGAAYAVVKVIPSTSFEFNIIDGASEWVDNSSQVACTAGVMVKMEIRAVKDSSGVRSLISDFNATEMSVYSVYGNTPYTTIPQQFGTDSLNMQTLPSADSDPKTVNVNFQGGVDTVWVLLNNAEDDGQKIIFSDTIDGIGEIYNEMKTDVYPGEMALVSVSSSPEPHSDYGDDITITANSTTSFYAHSYDAYGNYIGTEDATYTFDAGAAPPNWPINNGESSSAFNYTYVLEEDMDVDSSRIIACVGSFCDTIVLDYEDYKVVSFNNDSTFIYDLDGDGYLDYITITFGQAVEAGDISGISVVNSPYGFQTSGSAEPVSSPVIDYAAGQNRSTVLLASGDSSKYWGNRIAENDAINLVTGQAWLRNAPETDCENKVQCKIKFASGRAYFLDNGTRIDSTLFYPRDKAGPVLDSVRIAFSDSEKRLSFLLSEPVIVNSQLRTAIETGNSAGYDLFNVYSEPVKFITTWQRGQYWDAGRVINNEIYGSPYTLDFSRLSTENRIDITNFPGKVQGMSSGVSFLDSSDIRSMIHYFRISDTVTSDDGSAKFVITDNSALQNPVHPENRHIYTSAVNWNTDQRTKSPFGIEDFQNGSVKTTTVFNTTELRSGQHGEAASVQYLLVTMHVYDMLGNLVANVVKAGQERPCNTDCPPAGVIRSANTEFEVWPVSSLDQTGGKMVHKYEWSGQNEKNRFAARGGYVKVANYYVSPDTEGAAKRLVSSSVFRVLWLGTGE